MLRNRAIDERPARKPAGAATDSAWFVLSAPRRRQLMSFKEIKEKYFHVYIVNKK